MRVTYPDQRWTVARNTETAPTDAYGTMEFLGGPHPTKAQVLSHTQRRSRCLLSQCLTYNFIKQLSMSHNFVA